MCTINLLLGFLFFPLLARVLMPWSQRPWLSGWGIGLAQDLFVAAAQVNVLCLLNLTALIPFIFVTALIQLYHVLDALLLRLVGFRMRFSFFRYLLDFKDFRDSAIAFGIRPMLVASGLLFMLLAAAMWWARDALLAAQFSTPLLLVTLLSLGIGTIGLWDPWKGKMYLYHNCFFQEVASKSLQEVPEGGWMLTAQCEDSRGISPHYPLLKMTTGFHGDRQFNIRIEKGERPHIVIISVESFGAKHLGCLGNPHGASPQMDRLAKEGILFSRFHAAGIPTARSLLATLFGIYPDLDPFSLQETDPTYPLIGIPTLLKPYGYQSIYHKGGGLVFLNADVYLRRRGFDELAGEEEIAAAFPTSARTSWGIHDEQLFDYSLQKLKQQDEQGLPTFMTICTITNHHPWQVPPGFEAPVFQTPENPLYAQYLQTYYYSDAMVGRFIDGLRAANLAKNTLVFITADNGQPMGEHENNFMPIRGVYEENHHIPLLLLADGRLDQPKTLDTPCSQVDILPTLMDILNLQGLNHSMGTSLVRRAPERHVFCVNPHILPYVSHQEGKYKYAVQLQSDQRALYDLEADPDERENLLGTHPSIARKLNAQLVSHFTMLKKLYTEHRITPAANQTLVAIGEKTLTDHALKAKIRRQKALHTVILSDCPEISDEGVIAVAAAVTQLDSLTLDSLHISGKSLEAFQGKTLQLKEMILANCLGVSSGALTAFLSQCPEMLELSLRDAPQLEDDLLLAVAASCPRIINLELPGCSGLTDRGFHALATACPKLRRLNLISLPQMTDETLKILSLGNYDLHALHLLENSGITEKGIWEIIEANPHLQRLSFPATHVGDDTIKQIVRHCPDLMKLCLYDCRRLTAEGYHAIASGCRQLMTLELAGCPQLMDDFFLDLAKKPLDHLLIAGAPLVTSRCLEAIKTNATLRTLCLLHCPQLQPNAVKAMGEEMRQTGLIEEISLGYKKFTYTGF